MTIDENVFVAYTRLKEDNDKLNRKAELLKELKWERDTKTELAEHLGKANDKIADLEETINKLREQFALRYDLEDKIKSLEAQIEKMKSDVISERDHSLKIEDIITCTVLNDILKKWEIKENG